MMTRVCFALCFALLGLPVQAQTRAEIQAHVHTDLANRYYQVGQIATAVDEANAALKSDADNVPAHTLLALIYAQLYQNQQADMHFAAALKSDASTDVRNSYAWYLCSTNRGEQALQEFAKVLRDPLYGSLDKALINAGACAARLNRLDLALPYLEAALDANPNSGAAYIYRAHAFINAARYSDAAADMRKARALLPLLPETVWLQARLENAQNLPQFKNTILQLQRDFPTSEQANWARAGLYAAF